MPLKDRIAEAIEGADPPRSKADIARACGVTNAAVTHWLNGDTTSLKADTALALEGATGYRALWILTGRGTKKASEPFWPFASVPVGRYMALDEKQKGYVEAKLEEAIERSEQTMRAIYGPAVSDAKVEAHYPPAPTIKPGERLPGESKPITRKPLTTRRRA
jgi:transcriptional regulator with XRE-family HTH domain